MSNRPPPTSRTSGPRLQTGGVDPDGRSPHRPAGLPGARPQRRREQSRSSSVLLSILLWSFVTLAALAVGAASFVFVLAPTEMIRDELVQQLKARSGRDVAVAGPTSFSLFPSPAITIRDVALSPPPGMGGRPAVTAELIEAQVSVAPLWQRRVEIERLILRRPVIELRVDK
jgi:AsmA protein